MNHSVFYAFVRKEFYHILRDKWTTLILLLMPIVILLLLGFAITTEIKNAQIAVLDPIYDEGTRNIVQKLTSNEFFDVKYYIHSFEEAEELFQKGEISMVVIFSERFYQNLYHTNEAQIQLIADGSDPNYALSLTQYASGVIHSYIEEISFYQKNITPFRIHSDIQYHYNPTLKGGFNTVPGVLGMVLMLICAMMTSVSIAREKEYRTMEILLISPVKPIVIILAKTIPYIAISLINLTTILFLSMHVLDIPFHGNLVLFFLVSLIFIFVSLALGLLISSVSKSQLTAMLISGMLLLFPVILLSGIIFPIESMPLFFQWLSKIIPANWYIVAIKKIMIQGAKFQVVSFECMILIGMAVGLLLLSLKTFKNRIDS